MKKFLLFFSLLFFCNYSLMADRRPIVIHNGGAVGDHSEHFLPADAPEIYYDDDNQEIIIVGDGFADYYDVEIVSLGSMLTVIGTQIDGYGDSIDVSSLPEGDYRLVITSSNNNVYEGDFAIE